MVAQKPQQLKIDQKQALDQLEILRYSSGDAVYVRAFLPKEDPRYGEKGTARKADKLNFKQCEYWQAEGYGIHIVVNGGGHKDDDVTRCRAIFMEHDDLEIELQVNLWRTLGLPEPTLQVQTRKSVHSYWAIAEGCSVEKWKPLQADLLTYAGADLALKNPSRMMRLAGAYHIKPGHEPLRCNIIHNSYQRYSYSELRQAIPVPPPPVPSQLPSVPQLIELPQTPHRTATKYQRFEDIRVPVLESVPLEVCLSKASRELLANGVSQSSGPHSGRNSSGAAIARDFIGTESYLQAIGQRFSGDSQLLLNEYAERCTPPLDAKEVEAIWKSAQKDSPRPSIPPEGIETCIRAWYWKECIKPSESAYKRYDTNLNGIKGR
jgi:hypothetical protein